MSDRILSLTDAEIDSLERVYEDLKISWIHKDLRMMLDKDGVEILCTLLDKLDIDR